MASFRDVPRDLLARISKHLHSRDKKQLRLVSKPCCYGVAESVISLYQDVESSDPQPTAFVKPERFLGLTHITLQDTLYIGQIPSLISCCPKLCGITLTVQPLS